MHFIGVYDYTVILTNLGLISAVLGITQAIHGDYTLAVLCLCLSGVCDAFDGRVARSKKNRTETEKSFGIQLDSLCDMVCFGVFPALLCYLMGMRGWLGLAIEFFYCFCAVTRLAYFNVLESQRQQTEGGCNKTYHGLPVTSISFLLPVAFLSQFMISELAFLRLLHILLLVVGFLFILDFPMPKPGLKEILVLIVIMLSAAGAVLGYARYRVPGPHYRSNPVVEEWKDELQEDVPAQP